jgi:hypothetical protein
MAGRIKWSRRRSFYGVLVVALVASAIPISYALAGSTPSRVTVPVEKYDNSCDYLTGKKAIGKATIERTKSDSVKVTYTVNGAMPAGHYYIYLFTDSPISCNDIAYAGQIKIDASGHGSKTFEVTGLKGYTDFWVYANSDVSESDRSAVAHV